MASKALAGIPLVTLAPGRKNLSLLHRRIFFAVPLLRVDTNDGGHYKVSGTVAVSGTPDIPVVRLVGLFNKLTKRLVKSVISNADGTYIFTSVAYGPWFVVAWDCTGEFNAVISDNQAAELM